MTTIPIETNNNPKMIDKENVSSGKNIVIKNEPKIGIMNLKIEIIPALLYFNKVNHIENAIADMNDVYISIEKDSKSKFKLDAPDVAKP